MSVSLLNQLLAWIFYVPLDVYLENGFSYDSKMLGNEISSWWEEIGVFCCFFQDSQTSWWVLRVIIQLLDSCSSRPYKLTKWNTWFPSYFGNISTIIFSISMDVQKLTLLFLLILRMFLNRRIAEYKELNVRCWDVCLLLIKIR